MRKTTANSLSLNVESELIRIEAWGKGIRVRTVPGGQIPNNDWALDIIPPKYETTVTDHSVETENIRCEISQNGRLSFFFKDKMLSNTGYIHYADEDGCMYFLDECRLMRWKFAKFPQK